MANKKHSKGYKDRCRRRVACQKEYEMGKEDKQMIEYIIKSQILKDFPSISYRLFDVIKKAEQDALENLKAENEATFDIVEDLFETIQDIWFELGLCTFPEHVNEIMEVAERAASDILVLSILAFGSSNSLPEFQFSM